MADDRERREGLFSRVGKKLGEGRRRREAAWRSVAGRLGGEFLEREWGSSARIRLRHESWVVTADWYREQRGRNHSVLVTRLRAPFVPTGPVELKIYRLNALSRFFVRMGMKNVDSGRRDLNEIFGFKTSHPNRLRSMISGSRLGDVLRANGGELFDTVAIKKLDRKTRKKAGRGARELRQVEIRTDGVVEDRRQLANLFALAAVLLTELRKGACAKPEAVPIEE